MKTYTLSLTIRQGLFKTNPRHIDAAPGEELAQLKKGDFRVVLISDSGSKGLLRSLHKAGGDWKKEFESTVGYDEFDGEQSLFGILLREMDDLENSILCYTPRKSPSKKALDAWFRSLPGEGVQEAFPGLFDEIMASAEPERCTINHFYKEARAEWKALSKEEKQGIYDDLRGKYPLPE